MRPPPRPGPIGAPSRSPTGSSTDPDQIWIYDTTHFTRAGVAATVVEDLVSRKWLADVVSAEETSTQVQVVFTDALAVEGLLELVEARADGLVDPTVDDPARPILLAVSDNGPQMTSGSTREFMALCAIAPALRPARHPDRPGVDRELFGHIKAECPHLSAISDPAVLRAELAVVRDPLQRRPAARRHRLRHPHDEHEGRGSAIRKAREAGLEAARLRRLTYHRNQHEQTTQPETRRCWLIETGSLSRSRKQVTSDAWRARTPR